MALIFYFSQIVLMCAYFANAETPKCECAIFNDKADTLKYVSKDEPKPEISRPAEKIVLDADGKPKCDETCTTLAKEIVDGKPDEVYCKMIQHANNVLRALYYRGETGDWHRTSMVAKAPICCHEGKVTACAAA